MQWQSELADQPVIHKKSLLPPHLLQYFWSIQIPLGLVNILHINIEDIDVTEQLVRGAKLLDIEILDHIIIGNPRYISLKERLAW
jgi:hypothetical protein